MFLPNCRIERDNGIRFYEQDILCCEYVIAGDITIRMTADFMAPGLGVMLLADNGKPALKADKGYLFKVGYLDFSVIKKSFSELSVPLHASCPATPPMAGAEFIFTKSGNKIEIRINGEIAGQYTLAEPLDNYRIAFYSNAGNTLQNATIDGGLPLHWNVNVRNTNGGRIQFFRDGFKIENCEHELEVEQDDIALPKGTYTLKALYSSDEDWLSADIKPFIFLSGDARFDDPAKSILKGSQFTLDEDTKIDLKFKGKTGVVSDISIMDDPRSIYVPTEDEVVRNEGSYLIVKLTGLKEVRWKGIIYDIPDQTDLTKPADYAIAASKHKQVLLGDAQVSLSEEASYKFEVDGSKLYSPKAEIFLDIREDDEGRMTIFRDVNAVITELIVVQEDGTEINVIVQKTYKYYVPGSIKGPIIVTDENEIPLELSSSYREIITDGQPIYYQFSNWEREIFAVSEKLALDKTPLSDSGSVKVYAIPVGATVDEAGIYKTKAGIDTIDLSASRYDIIPETEFTIEDGTVVISSDLTTYQMLIVDYLKQESYCINYLADIDNYEVDIASNKDLLYIIYDNAGDYLVTEIQPDSNKFIVLRRA